MQRTVLRGLYISLPMSNIELKQSLEREYGDYSISLPISNIELKRVLASKTNRPSISLPISNIELKRCLVYVPSSIPYQFTYIQH